MTDRAPKLAFFAIYNPSFAGTEDLEKDKQLQKILYHYPRNFDLDTVDIDSLDKIIDVDPVTHVKNIDGDELVEPDLLLRRLNFMQAASTFASSFHTMDSVNYVETSNYCYVSINPEGDFHFMMCYSLGVYENEKCRYELNHVLVQNYLNYLYELCILKYDILQRQRAGLIHDKLVFLDDVLDGFALNNHSLKWLFQGITYHSVVKENLFKFQRMCFCLNDIVYQSLKNNYIRTNPFYDVFIEIVKPLEYVLILRNSKVLFTNLDNSDLFTNFANVRHIMTAELSKYSDAYRGFLLKGDYPLKVSVFLRGSQYTLLLYMLKEGADLNVICLFIKRVVMVEPMAVQIIEEKLSHYLDNSSVVFGSIPSQAPPLNIIGSLIIFNSVNKSLCCFNCDRDLPISVQSRIYEIQAQILKSTAYLESEEYRVLLSRFNAIISELKTKYFGLLSEEYRHLVSDNEEEQAAFVLLKREYDVILHKLQQFRYAARYSRIIDEENAAVSFRHNLYDFSARYSDGSVVIARCVFGRMVYYVLQTESSMFEAMEAFERIIDKTQLSRVFLFR
ncbi:hypothetical protein PCE1_002616 [Barthelona sp. PCE]